MLSGLRKSWKTVIYTIGLMFFFVETCIAKASVETTTNFFPSIEAVDLAGNTRSFPGGLPSNPTLLVVAFAQKQQQTAVRLTELLAETEATKLGYVVLETPVIQDPGMMMRFIIDNDMRSGIPSVEVQKAVVTLYVPDLEVWLKATGIASTESVYICAITHEGKILRTASENELKTAEDMKSYIDAVKSELAH